MVRFPRRGRQRPDVRASKRPVDARPQGEDFYRHPWMFAGENLRTTKVSEKRGYRLTTKPTRIWSDAGMLESSSVGPAGIGVTGAGQHVLQQEGEARQALKIDAPVGEWRVDVAQQPFRQ